MIESSDIEGRNGEVSSPSVIFIDVDGVIGSDLLRVSTPDTFLPLQRRHLASIGKLLKFLQPLNIRPILCTGRATDETSIIASEANLTEYICENGGILSRNGTETLLMPNGQIQVANFLVSKLSLHLADLGNHMIFKKTIATVQIPLDMKGDFGQVKTFKDKLVTQARQLTQFAEYERSDSVLVAQSSDAIDMTPIWDKGRGVREYLLRFGYNPDRALAIGDSGPDIAMMEIVRFAAGPSNSSSQLLEYLTPKVDMGTGFISMMPLSMGMMDILNQFRNMLLSQQNLFLRETQRPRPANPHIIQEYLQEISEARIQK